VERPLGAAQPLGARTAAVMPAEEVVVAGQAEQPGPAVRLAVAELKPRAAQPTAAASQAAAGPMPQAAWQPAVGVVATAELRRLVGPQPAEPLLAEAEVAAAAGPRVAAGLPEAWPQPWAAVSVASRRGSRTPRDRRS